VDLVKGYHQVPMAKADIPKAVIGMPFGLFEYLFMPFGLKNYAQTFQRQMYRKFRHLPFLFVYLYDILIASKLLEEHLDHLRQLFEVMQENGLQANPDKCMVLVSSLSFRAQGERGQNLAIAEASGGSAAVPVPVGSEAAPKVPGYD
jgi:hypothetical protein